MNNLILHTLIFQMTIPSLSHKGEMSKRNELLNIDFSHSSTVSKQILLNIKLLSDS